ncbi:MAG: autotransporter outer membrane beta-barrel domain-containing protein [Caulobacterales bacterium]|nr:autotransporter outer membrane beta-barrel domain-containing protein [Caulobacterales bacterium]
MQRKLLATVAAAPILLWASAGLAETTVTNTRTTGVSTATATGTGPDDIRVTDTGAINLTSAGAAITLNSNNSVTNGGNILTTDVDDTIGILVLGGYTGKVTNNTAIFGFDTVTNTDTDNDGDLDGAFSSGKGRYGIRIIGPGAFTGDILNSFTGNISVRGADAKGISVETSVVGSILNEGVMTVVGDRSRAIDIKATVSGDVTSLRTVNVTGDAAIGIDVGADIGGQLRIQGPITTYGYRYIERPFFAEDRAKLDADDLLQSGSALRITNNIGKGLFLDAPPEDLIPDDGKSDTTTDSDEDGDGITDLLESTGGLTVYGGAPALAIGSATQSVTLGPAGTGALNYGIVNLGGISASGIYDGVAATGALIGSSTGQSVIITNGIRNAGSIGASSYEADAIGLHLLAGAQVGTLVNDGSVAAATISEGAFNARGILIEQGATLNTINVGKSGQISGGVSGEKSNAIAIEDRSGTLQTINNSGKIGGYITQTDDADDKDDADTDASNEVVTGKAIAMDLRSATAGVTIRQTGVADGDDGKDGIDDGDTDGDGVDDADEPSIRGDILLSAHNDVVDIQNGVVAGSINFGGGQDTLSISGGALVSGQITDPGGSLAINLGKGTLSVTNPEPLQLSSLNIANDGTLLISADPSAGTNTKLIVSGAANLASGAKIGLTLQSVMDSPTRFTVIEAGSLTAGAINPDLVGLTPYLYIAQATADQSAGKVYLDVRARTASELGFNRAQTSAYNAVLKAIGNDDAIEASVLSQTTRAGLVNIYDQMLPDTGEGMFAAIDTANQLMAQATSQRPDPHDRYGPDSFWVQEINTFVRRDDADTLGSDSQVFGFMGGYESMSANGGALGLTLAYVNVEEHDSAAVVGERTTASVVQGGVYWRRAIGGLSLNAGAGAGYAWFDGTRRIITGDADGNGAADLIRTNNADWTGTTGNAFAGASYQAAVGRFYARPELRVDYLYLKEGERKESGGGSAMDLLIKSRSASNVSGEAAVTFGANFGRDVWIRPEIRVGYRQSLSGQLDPTIAQFSGGTPFVITPNSQDDGAMTLNLALRSGTAMSYLALEAGAEARKKQKRYNVRLNGRVMF